jgi:hypothetical protein
MTNTWGILWTSTTKLDGTTRHLIYVNCLPALFNTKKEAKHYIDEKYGYIKDRQDLRGEPHCWRVPKPIKVYFTYTIPEGK